MTSKNLKNVAASVHQKLLNLAQERKRPFNELLQLYAIERFLYRLCQSTHKSRFILKGALTMLVWNVNFTRPTRDIDLLGKIGNDLDLIRDIISQICQQSVDPDGLQFDSASVKTERIAEDADYHGVRAIFLGFLGNARIPMQIDIGFSDIITPEPIEVNYPTLLDSPRAQLLAYNPETAIAEKLEAMVSLGQLNSRMKDFFDIWALAQTNEFDGKLLAHAIRQTFANRNTLPVVEPLCLTEGFASDKTKEVQWASFIRNSQLSNAPKNFSEAIATIRQFLQPILEALVNNADFQSIWKSDKWVKK